MKNTVSIRLHVMYLFFRMGVRRGRRFLIGGFILFTPILKSPHNTVIKVAFHYLNSPNPAQTTYKVRSNPTRSPQVQNGVFLFKILFTIGLTKIEGPNQKSLSDINYNYF